MTLYPLSFGGISGLRPWATQLDIVVHAFLRSTEHLGLPFSVALGPQNYLFPVLVPAAHPCVHVLVS